jgi:hypothetical protein
LPSAVLTCLPPAELVTFLSDQVAACASHKTTTSTQL